MLCTVKGRIRTIMKGGKAYKRGDEIEVSQEEYKKWEHMLEPVAKGKAEKQGVVAQPSVDV